MCTHGSGGSDHDRAGPGHGDPAAAGAVVQVLAARLQVSPAELLADFARHDIEVTSDSDIEELLSLRARIAWADENWPH